MNRSIPLLLFFVSLVVLAGFSRVCSANERVPIAVLGESSRGVAGSVEVRYEGARLVAKTIDDLSAPMMVRVTDAGEDTYRVEFLGLVSGDYDLAEYLELENGRTAAGLGALPVRVHTQLPPEYGTDIFGLGASSLGISAHYRTLVGIGIVLWLGVPVFALVRRFLRVPPPSEQIIQADTETPAEQLLALVKLAKSRSLSHSEKGRLELLLLRVLREQGDAPSTNESNSPGQLARAIAELRRSPQTAALVASVEKWLHSDEGDRAAADALAALDATRAQTTAFDGTDSRVGAS